MAFEELLQLLERVEAADAKQAEAMRMTMLATAERVLASGELASADPKWKAIAERGEAHGLEVLGKAAPEVETITRTAAEFAATPGGEAVAEAYRRVAAGAVALAARAQEFVTFMRDIAVLAAPDSDSESDSVVREPGRPAARRCRTKRPNARYFGPEWTS